MMTQRNGSETGGKKALLLAGSCVGDGWGVGGYLFGFLVSLGASG